MSTSVPRSEASNPVVYPDSDGEPIAETTLQFNWIAKLYINFVHLFRERPDVFVAGDLLWYPVEGDPKTRIGPDVLVAFGRPKGERGSYRQWEEGGITPQVVFEILSPGNTPTELARKLRFYDRFGVEEYYQYDPDRVRLRGWLRDAGGALRELRGLDGWTSPRLGIRFDLTAGPELSIHGPDGRRFMTTCELADQRDALEQWLGSAEQRAETAEQRAETAEQRAERLAAQLRALGIEPEA